MSSTPVKVLLDSTYILPSFGVEVEGLPLDEVAKIREIGLKGKVKFYCLSASWIEVIGKVCREKERLKADIGKLIEVAVRSLLDSGFYQWLTPTSDAVKLAFKLRMLGHRDNIDNLLYASAAENNILFLTMDEDFKNFLVRNGFKVDNLIDHKHLLKKIG